MSFEFWLFFCFTVFVASIIPGPSMLLALTHGIRYGFKRTIATACGNVSATFLQAMISISGLSVILTASDTVFMVIKWIGALYLIYVGCIIFFSRTEIGEIDKDLKSDRGSVKNMYFQAFFVAFGNPKAIVFFTALFPQFISTEKSTLPQFIILVTSLLIIAFVCILIYAYFGRKMARLFNSKSLSGHISKITGISFVGAGLAIIFND